MMTAAEYAEKHGYKAAMVKSWCKEGNLPGVQKEPTGKSGMAAWRYMIPEDAKPVRAKRPYEKKREEEQTPEPPKPLKRLRTRREKCEHIRKYCITRTYRQLMAETGMTHEEIRHVYDRLHEAGCV